ncbi:unnamed protein product [Cochlearia groenlandica]
MANMVNVMMSTILVNTNLIVKIKTPRLQHSSSRFINNALIKNHGSRRNVISYSTYNNKYASRMSSSCLNNGDDSRSNKVSGYDIVMKFYSSINEKNHYLLSSCISKDCFIDDFSFSKPFLGKNEALKFFEELGKSMGQNVKFCIENVCEGDGYNAVAVNWHLEWKGRKIPFTRGCSFYEFTQESGSLVIRNAKILIESPIKPGGIALTLLKNITFLFDEFPQIAEWFLEKPYTIIVLMLRMYGLLLAPIISHIMKSYLKLLNNMAEFLLLVFKIIIKIRSFFSK